MHFTLSTTPFPLVSAIGQDGKYYPTPADDEPPEADEDSMHGVNRFQQIHRQASKAKKIQEDQFEKDQSIFIKALSQEQDVSEEALSSKRDLNSGDDLFGEIDIAIAMKRKEFVKQGLIVDKAEKVVDELDPEEAGDLEEIEGLQGLAGAEDADVERSDFEVSEEEEEEEIDGEGENGKKGSGFEDFDIDFDEFGKSKARIIEPKFRMSLAELLDESKVVPVSVYGNLEVEIGGINHDSRLVENGDLFVCRGGGGADEHLNLSEADKRGAVAIVASKEIAIEETLGCKALVIVEDTSSVLAALAAAFYSYPSTGMSVIGITGTNGKTTTSFLVKGVYEAMGLRTGS